MSLRVFELGFAGAAFIGRASAPLRLVSQCRAILSMDSTVVFLPTVANVHPTAAFIVSDTFFFHIFIYSFLVDLTQLYYNALLVSDYKNLHTCKSHVHNFVNNFNTFDRTWRPSRHGQDSVQVSRHLHFGGVALC